MIKVDGIEYRNLQEQVLKNKEDIAAHYNIDRVIADFGIRVIGSISSPQYLPNPDTYKGNYGDAYTVGTEPPYDFYVWTRADVDAGYPNDYWFNIGELAIIGPKGDRGEQGPEGPKGEATTIHTGDTLPPSDFYVETIKPGDYFLPKDQKGELYQLIVNQSGARLWKRLYNLTGPVGSPGQRGLPGERGPQGQKGPKGDTGDVGGFINIRGILDTPDQLPNPEVLKDLSAAYLIKRPSDTQKDLWIQVGEKSENAYWTNAGPFNAATLVTVNGEAQNVWDADTKLDKAVENAIVYGTTPQGAQTTIQYNDTPVGGGIAQRTNDGRLKAANPTEANDTATKDYTDTQIAAINTITDSLGDSITNIETEIDNNRFVMTNAQTMTDEQKTQARTNIGAIGGSGREVVFGTDIDGAQKSINYSDEPRTAPPDADVIAPIAQYTKKGTLQSNAPTDNSEVATKGYTDPIYSTKKVAQAIGDITDIDAFRTYFYNQRKSTTRHYQFEISNGGEHYDLMSILGYPEGVNTSTELFLYIDLPYSEAGGFEIDLTLMGRNTSEYFTRIMHSTLNSQWQDSGWKDPTAAELKPATETELGGVKVKKSEYTFQSKIPVHINYQNKLFVGGLFDHGFANYNGNINTLHIAVKDSNKLSSNNIFIYPIAAAWITNARDLQKYTPVLYMKRDPSNTNKFIATYIEDTTIKTMTFTYNGNYQSQFIWN